MHQKTKTVQATGKNIKSEVNHMDNYTRPIISKIVLPIFTAAVVLMSAGCTVSISVSDSSNSNSSKSSKVSVTSSDTKASSTVLSEAESQISSEKSQTSADTSVTVTYTMADIAKLQNVDYFAKGTLEHIFDGTINKKGNATGYHYTMVTDSKGEIIEGTRSKTDKNGVFTGKVKVSGKTKNGFSSFYPESWTPQQVVDAINTAYEDAISDPDNPSGSLWIGHSGNIEIDMYLDNNKKITTAYPVYERG